MNIIKVLEGNRDGPKAVCMGLHTHISTGPEIFKLEYKTSLSGSLVSGKPSTKKAASFWTFFGGGSKPNPTVVRYFCFALFVSKTGF